MQKRKVSRISVCDNICLDCFEIPYRAKPLTILNDGHTSSVNPCWSEWF